MLRSKFLPVPVIVGILLVGIPAGAQQTVGLFINEPESFAGYTLFPKLNNTETYLIDHHGKLVHQWSSGSIIGNVAYLLPDGNLMRAVRFEPVPIARFNAGGRGGKVEVLEWDGTVVWDFPYASDTYRHHHDIAPMPNGNGLLIAWELKTDVEAIQAGRDPIFLPDAELWPETIVEVEPTSPTTGTIVWEWRLWDHVVQDFDPTKDNFGVVGDHPELVDINFLAGRTGSADWLHANAVDYNPELDQILLSTPFLNEIWIIDHSTTTAEAAGHSGGNSGKGGDLLYRWGNPQAYDRGDSIDQLLFNQHDPEWIDPGLPGAGRILIFNNGAGRPIEQFTTIDEIVTPVEMDGNYSLEIGQAYAPALPSWTYVANPPASFFAGFLSSAQRLPNGNTLIDSGPTGVFFEVTNASNTVWRYVNPVSTAAGPIEQGTAPTGNNVFRVERYAADYAGLIGQDLTPGDPLELFNAPVPVPDGSGGTTALTALKLDATGTQLRFGWDPSCLSFDYNLIYGDLNDVGSYSILGGECSIGVSGTYDWLSVAAGDLYFLVVGIDDTGVYESSWGTDGAGAERNGGVPSWVCTATSKIVTQTCP